MQTPTTLIRVPTDLHAAIKARATANGRTMVAELRRLVDVADGSDANNTCPVHFGVCHLHAESCPQAA